MNDAQFREWLNQNGGERRRQEKRVTVKRPNPDRNAEQKEISESETHTEVEAMNGATITLRRLNPGEGGRTQGPLQGGADEPTYEVLGQTTAATQARPDTASNSPADRALDAEKQREREWNRDNGGLYETHAERREREAKDNAANNPPITNIRQDENTGKWLGLKGGQWVEIPGGPGAAEGSQPITNLTQDRATGKWFGVQAGKWVEVPGGPGANQKAYTQIKQDPNTGGWHGLTADGRWEAIQGGPGIERKPGLPASTTGWTPRLDQPGLGIYQRRDQLRTYYQDRIDRGLMSETEAAAAYNRDIQADHDYAQLIIQQASAGTANERTIYDGDIRQRGDDLSAANSRLTAATNIHTNALSQMSALAPTAGAPAAKAYRQMVREAEALARRFGGLDTPPRVQPRPGGYLAMPPMSEVMGGASAPGVAPAAAPGQPATAPPAQPQAPSVPGAPQPEAAPNPMAPTMDPMGGQNVAALMNPAQPGAQLSPAIAGVFGGGTRTVSDILADLGFDQDVIRSGVDYRASLLNGGEMTPGAMVGM